MMELSVVRPPGYDAYDIYIFKYGPRGEHYYVTFEKGEEDEFPLLKVNEIREAEVAKPILRLTGPFVQAHGYASFAMQLVDWICSTFRITPSAVKDVQGYNRGKLDAVLVHLADMRKLVFDSEPKVETRLRIDPNLFEGEEE